MSAVPPSNGKSTPFLLILTVWATPRSSMMSPPATRVQLPAGSKASVARGSFAVRPHASIVSTAPTPNSSRSPQPRVRTDGSTTSARRNARRLRFAARSVESVAASGARTSRFASDGRSAPTATRIASASDSTSSSASYVLLVPARTAPTSSRPVRSSCVRKWVTGTIGMSTIGVDVGVGGAVGAIGDAEAGGTAAVALAPALGTWPIGVVGLDDGVSDPTSPPPTVRTMAAARTARTVTTGSRFTAAIVTAGLRWRLPVRPSVRRVRVDGVGTAERSHRRPYASAPRSSRGPRRSVPSGGATRPRSDAASADARSSELRVPSSTQGKSAAVRNVRS